jgi:hypothetical protein
MGRIKGSKKPPHVDIKGTMVGWASLVAIPGGNCVGMMMLWTGISHRCPLFGDGLLAYQFFIIIIFLYFCQVSLQERCLLEVLEDPMA